MQKAVTGQAKAALDQTPELGWIDLESEAAVELTSEDPARPIESALDLRDGGTGWRAAEPGPQTIRLIFNQPRRISRVRLKFTEEQAERTQEFVLRSGPGQSGPLRDVVRQQWNFSPQGSTAEVEDYRLNLEGVVVLELGIKPDMGGRKAFASLDELRVA